jgi:DNA-binding LacI/PurR family transcriptional regulator
MVTLKQIAQRVNVSTSVVSHVLNSPAGNTRVSKQKRELIERVAQELQYVPNLRARSLVTRRTQAIGFVSSRSYVKNSHKSDAYFHAILNGIEEVCRAAGYKCLYARYEPADIEEIVYPRSVRDGSVDGVVFAGYTPAEALRKLAAMNVPCVQVGTNVEPDSEVQCFTSDLGRAFERVVRRLREMGHKHVQLVLPGGPGPQGVARKFQSLATIVPGIEPEVAMMETLASNRDSALAHARAMLKRARRPTAFICNPVHSQGLAEGLAEGGMLCPRDYSIACFGIPESEDQRLYPGNVRVSFIVLPVEEAGRRAAAALLGRLGVDGFEMPQRVPRVGGCPTTYIPCEVVFTESCGPARGSE